MNQINPDWYNPKGRVSERARFLAYDGPMDPYLMQVHMSTIPHMAGEENSWDRRPMTIPQIREAYASRLQHDQSRMERFMGVGPRARSINLNMSDPNTPLVITPGSDWLKEVLSQQQAKFGKTRMVIDRDILKQLPGW